METEGARVFRTPWQSIVGSMQNLAESHAMLASKMESDVERPLKEYQSKSREMQAMTTIQGNLASVAKEVDNAHKKASKLSGGKSSANKVANATSDVEAANQQWDSQAPYVFEQLQSLDETRVNHLRDVLTQLETHEVDLVERNRTTAESCLNALLNVDTSDEISTFVARVSGGGEPGEVPRLGSRGDTGSRISGGGSGESPRLGGPLHQPPPVAPRVPSSATTPSRTRAREDSGEGQSPYSTASRATTAGPPPKSGFGGLRRLGTVLGGRSGKGGKGMDRPPSPEKRSRPTRNPLRRGPSSRQDMQTIPSPPISSTHLPSSPPRQQPPLPKMSSSQSIERPRSRGDQPRRNDQPNGDTSHQAPTRVSSLPMTNGVAAISTNRDLDTVQESQFTPPGPPPGKAAVAEPEPQRDAEGYSVPSSAVDDITRAEQEAAAAG